MTKPFPPHLLPAASALSVALMLVLTLATSSMANPLQTPLLQALQSGNAEAVASELERGADPNQLLPDGSTPLAWAVEVQDHAMLRLLLAAGGDPNAAANAAASPLIVGCQYGDGVVLDQLLKAGAKVDFILEDGLTPLHVCAGHAPVGVLEQMLAAGADADGVDRYGQTPLMQAAAHGKLDNIALLLQHGAAVNRVTNDGLTPLFYAAESKALEPVLAIINAGGDAGYIGPQDTTLVQMASYHGNHALVAWLVEQGIDLAARDRHGYQLLHAAIIANQPALVTTLINHGADVNALTGPSRIELRLEPDAVGTDNAFSAPIKPPLIMATELGLTDLMQLLVDAGADINFRMDDDGTDIVLAATASMKPDTLRLALTLKPDANTQAKNGRTPLHALVGGGGTREEVAVLMQLLKQHGARTDIANRRGKTATDMLVDAQSGPKAAFAEVFAQ